MDGLMDHGCMNTQMIDGLIEAWVGGQMNGYVDDGWTDGYIDGWMDDGWTD